MRTAPDRERLIKAAAANHTFTIKQVASLLSKAEFSKEKLTYLNILATTIDASGDLSPIMKGLQPSLNHVLDLLICRSTG
jgi:hypothetical protein